MKNIKYTKKDGKVQLSKGNTVEAAVKEIQKIMKADGKTIKQKLV